MLATMSNTATGAVLTAMLMGARTGILNPVKHDDLQLPAGQWTVALRKITDATPFSMGIANQLGLTPSAFHFRGVQLAEGVTLEESRPQRRQITFIGASDTAGFCAKIALISV